MKARQFCSVCKQWLDMEVVPTGDGDEDDGVIWFRCPQCQGFLPKLGGDLSAPAGGPAAPDVVAPDASVPDVSADDDLPWDSPADMMAARRAAPAGEAAEEPGDEVPDLDLDAEDLVAAAGEDDEGDADDDAAVAADDDEDDAAPAAEPIAEYAALLAALDPAAAVPYRPWHSYEVGQCVHHLAWDDCGVVVAKESLPGGRRGNKCYFATAGVVRLIEEAPQ